MYKRIQYKDERPPMSGYYFVLCDFEYKEHERVLYWSIKTQKWRHFPKSKMVFVNVIAWLKKIN